MERFWKYKVDHVIFWTATVGFHMFTRLDLVSKAGVDHFFLEIIIRNGLLALLIYANLSVLMPRFAQQGRVIAYIFSLMGALSVYVLLKNAHDVYLFRAVSGHENERDFFDNSYYNLSIALFYLAFSIALQLSKAWYFQRELIRKMEIDKLNTELEYLKSQINPHFLFNSINTIYFQIDSQNETARQSLSSFSEMLRYQLYECNGKEIPIEKEVNYLKNYVSLQRMRKDENYHIAFHEGEDLHGFSISPLLLIPFVENAFKHVSHFCPKNEIRIELGRRKNYFRLTVFNTKELKETEAAYMGIGLKNAKRRLELLYKDRHELVIEDTQDGFLVKLALRINGQ